MPQDSRVTEWPFINFTLEIQIILIRNWKHVRYTYSYEYILLSILYYLNIYINIIFEYIYYIMFI